jgi:hypothetical protein
VWLLPGCQTPSDSGDGASDELMTREQVVDLEDEYGGFNFADESVAFGDPYLLANYGDVDEAYDDATNDDPAVVRERRLRHPVRYLMITWGNLEADTTIDFPTDWSGSLSAQNGAIVLKRTIRFDARDEILPRTSRDLLEWRSVTQPNFDGILVALHKIVTSDSTVTAQLDVPFSITFKTEPLTVTIQEKDLVDLHRVVTVDDAGNAVAFNTITVMPDACPSGFLAGQWRNVPDRPGGIFRGKWISENGAHMGFLRGVYGTRQTGEKVFFGKWINRGGRFQGLLVGKYGSYPDAPGGWFEGVWLNRALVVKGKLGGVWQTNPNVDAVSPGRGFFRGRWQMACR